MCNNVRSNHEDETCLSVCLSALLIPFQIQAAETAKLQMNDNNIEVLDKESEARVAHIMSPILSKVQSGIELEDADIQLARKELSTVAAFSSFNGELTEVTAFHRNTCPSKWVFLDGRHLPIIGLDGTIYYANIALWFASENSIPGHYSPSEGFYLQLPDLRNRFIRGWTPGRQVGDDQSPLQANAIGNASFNLGNSLLNVHKRTDVARTFFQGSNCRT